MDSDQTEYSTEEGQLDDDAREMEFPRYQTAGSIFKSRQSKMTTMKTSTGKGIFCCCCINDILHEWHKLR